MPAFAGSLVWVSVAVVAFHLAYALPALSLLVLVYLFALLQLSRADHWRLAFYPGLAVGLLIAAFRLAFFWRLFSWAAFALWLVYAVWIALFVALARLARLRLGAKWCWLVAPFLWTGLEYFRSELYYLRFSWLNPGYAVSGAPWQSLLGLFGVYGVGFLITGISAGAAYTWPTSRRRAVCVLAMGMCCLGLGSWWCRDKARSSSVQVSGIQMEFPTEQEVLKRLNLLIADHPDTELVVLSEYTFDGPIPDAVKAWCRENRVYLIAGGKEPAPDRNFFNTAFVIGPSGEVVFRQVKAVPIQFFKDGQPATEQKPWDSPWGKLGLCICYDLSYTRVTDQLVSAGAEALIVPTMDVADWGPAQHKLHARIAPARATEYALPIFRLASSGISQLVDSTGRVGASAPCPGDGAVLTGTLTLSGPGHRPPDRWLGPFAVGLTAVFAAWCLVRPGRRMVAPTSGEANIQHSPSNNQHPERSAMPIIGCWMLDVECWMFSLLGDKRPSP